MTGSNESDIKTFSHYEIVETIGRGGMGEVFLARDTLLERRVALKLLPESQPDDTAKKRFLREAKSAAALDHPYICKIYETGEAEGRLFIAMEYVRGATLAHRIAQESLTLDEARKIALEIAEALEAAHAEKIVHRDLKPSNIMLTEGGHVKVMDFALAKRVAPGSVDSQSETPSRIPGESTTLGEAAYMSPEQLRGEDLDTRSDIFSFGMCLYEMVAGVHPFERALAIETAAAILNEEPAPLSRYRQGIPEVLEHVVRKMLAKALGERYQLVHDVRTDLELLEAPPARMDDPRPERGKARWATAGLMGLALIAGLGLWSLLSDVREPNALPSVAVLPLTNVSEDPMESDYLAEGISRAVTTRLTQVGLRVTPWETASRYEGRAESAQALAKELNVDAVLVGTFEISGDEILTNLSLVESKSGFQSWADIIVEPYDDLFRMQLRIATEVASSLKKELTGEDEQALAVPESTSVNAYDFYLQGAYILQETNPESMEVAFEYFTRAIELDPTLADAYVGLGAVHGDRYTYAWGGHGELERAEASYGRALELNPTSMRARSGLIYLSYIAGRTEECLVQGQLSDQHGRSNDVETLRARAEALGCAGLIDRALPLFRRAIELDPVNAGAYYWMLMSSWRSGAPEQTLEAGDAFLRLFGDNAVTHTRLAYAHHLLGDHDRAVEHYRMAIGHEGALNPDTPPGTFFFAGILLDELGDRAGAEQHWRWGSEILQLRLEAYPDNAALRMALASYLGLLGERAEFLQEESRALEGLEVAPWYFDLLIATHARLGETERAVELLGLRFRSGSVAETWKAFVKLAFAFPLESEALAPILAEAEREMQRLRETY